MASRQRTRRASHVKKSRGNSVPQPNLVQVSDALATICATVDVAASALAKDENEALSVNAGQVLLEHVYEPLEQQREIIEAHSKSRRSEALLRKKHAANGSRKDKSRQRNRLKDRQNALKPWGRT